MRMNLLPPRPTPARPRATPQTDPASEWSYSPLAIAAAGLLLLAFAANLGDIGRHPAGPLVAPGLLLAAALLTVPAIVWIGRRGGRGSEPAALKLEERPDRSRAPQAVGERHTLNLAALLADARVKHRLAAGEAVRFHRINEEGRLVGAGCAILIETDRLTGATPGSYIDSPGSPLKKTEHPAALPVRESLVRVLTLMPDGMTVRTVHIAGPPLKIPDLVPPGLHVLDEASGEAFQVAEDGQAVPLVDPPPGVWH